jgi:hypothetical protein
VVPGYVAGLSDEELVELVRENALETGGGGHVARFMVNNTYTPAEIRGVYAVVGWLFQEWPTLAAGETWKLMIHRFSEQVPDRGEEGLVGLIKAMGEDMPGTPLVSVLP